MRVHRVEKEGKLERAKRTSKATSSGWNLGGILLGLEASMSKGVRHPRKPKHSAAERLPQRSEGKVVFHTLGLISLPKLFGLCCDPKGSFTLHLFDSHRGLGRKVN